MKIKKQQPEPYSPDFDWEDIRHYMKMSPKDKLDYLEKMVLFLNKITPEKSKETARMLRELRY